MSNQIFTASTTYTVPVGGFSNMRIFMIGGGASGFPSHSGAGGAGFIQDIAIGTVSAGTTISITIGAGGQRATSTPSGPAFNGGSTTVTIGDTTYTAAGGANYIDVNSPGGNGSSGGGGAGNSGYGGNGGSGGSDGATGAQYGGGTGMGVNAFNNAIKPTMGVLSAGAGGAAGTSSHAGGGGAGGIITNLVAYPTAEDGGSSSSGKGGVGFGAGGGSGGYTDTTTTYFYGGAGAHGMVYIYSFTSWNLSDVYNSLNPHLSSFKPSTFYSYLLDGDSTYISDGGHDMYDAGNYTYIRNNETDSDLLSYNTTSVTEITISDSNVKYVSLGYAHPLVMLATSQTRGTWGFKKTGNLGSDGNTGSTGAFYTLYNGSDISGFIVYAHSFNWWIQNTIADDPTITNIFFHIGKTDSTFHSTTPTQFNSPTNFSGNNSIEYVLMDTTNTLFGTMLLSTYNSTTGPVPTSFAAQQTVISNLVKLLKTQAPALGDFNMTKTFGDSSFTITQPSSLSSGAFTYSITSGTDIISISGNIITILKVGSATVQASQAASGSYLAATKTATITINRATATLDVRKSIFYQKFVSGASVLFDVIYSNAGTVSRTHESNNTSIVSIPLSSAPSATIVGPGKTTIKVTQPQQTNYEQVIEYNLITIVIVGQGQTYTSENMTNTDFSNTNLSGSAFSSCILTNANLSGATVNSSTNFSSATLTNVRSGRIIGTTTLLPSGFKMI